MTYDAIIVGARVAGSSTAMLLARRGYRVLVVDRAAFPSDTLSTHQVQACGGVLLKRWGLLEQIVASGCPAARHLIFKRPDVTLEGYFPSVDDVDAVHSPRRQVLDKLLVDAAVAAGAEVRERVSCEEVLIESGSVVGIRTKGSNGRQTTERGRIVIGCDGRLSKVAQAVAAPKYNDTPPLSCAYYTYFADLPVSGGELYDLKRRIVSLWPTNDALTMMYVAAPIGDVAQIRANPEAALVASADLDPTLGERIRGSRRAERIRGTAELENYFRRPYGSGWALVGDAGLRRDPIAGMGISDAFRDVEFLVDALVAAFETAVPLEEALAGYEGRRNSAAQLPYKMTLEKAAFAEESVEQRLLFESLLDRPKEITRFFGMLTGLISPEKYFSTGNLYRVLGAELFVQVARLRQERHLTLQ